MECQMKRGTKETLSTNDQTEINLSLGYCYTEETTNDTMGYVAIEKPSTAPTDWPNDYWQLSLFELPNQENNAQDPTVSIDQITICFLNFIPLPTPFQQHQRQKVLARIGTSGMQGIC